MSVPLRTYNFFLSTRERDAGSSINNATWTLTDPLVLNTEIPSYFVVSVKHATIPFSFYQWNQYTNTSDWSMIRGSTGYTGTYTITESNYTALTLKTEFISKITSAIQSVSGYTPSITGTYDTYSNKYSFTLSNDGTPTTITFPHNVDYDYLDVGLGFTNTWVLSSGNTTISDGMVNVNPSRNLYLWSTNLFTRNYEALNTNMTNSTNLCTIPIYTLPNSYIIYDSPNQLTNELTNNQISSINLQIKSENIPYNLQQMKLDWSCTLQIQEMTTNFILQSHQETVKEYQRNAEMTLEQQLELQNQKSSLLEKLERDKKKESERISKAINKENARLVKQQKKEESARFSRFSKDIEAIKQ